MTQRQIYDLKDKRKALKQAVEEAKLALKKVVEIQRYNEFQIKECADFLQEQCPNAVKGTWHEEMEEMD